MKQDRSRFAFLNLGSSTIKSIITTLVALVTTPFIIRQVGDADFGLFKTLITFYGQFSILEFGLYNTVRSLLINDIAGPDEVKGSVINWGIKQFRKSALLCLTISALSSYFVYQRFSTEINKTDLVLSIITAHFFFFFLPFNPYRAYLESHHKSYIVSWLQLLSSLATTLASVIFIFYYPSVSALMIATLIGILIANIFMRRHLPKSVLAVKDFSTRNMDKKLQFSFFMNEIAGKLCLMIDELTISFMMGPKYVVPFFISQRLPQVILVQLLNIGNSSWSTLGMIYKSNEMELFNRRLIEITKLTAVIGSSVLVVIAVFNQNFINLWINHKEFAGSWFTIIVCLNTFILPILTTWGWCFNYSQLINKLTPITTAQTIVNVVFSVVLTLRYGIMGPVLGTLLSNILVPIIFMGRTMKKEFGVSLLRLHLSWALPLLFSSACYLAATHITWITESTGWTLLILKMSLAGFVVLSTSVFLFFSKSEKIEYLERIQKLIKKKA